MSQAAWPCRVVTSVMLGLPLSESGSLAMPGSDVSAAGSPLSESGSLAMTGGDVSAGGSAAE